MTSTVLLVCSLIAAGPATGPSAEDLATYEAARASVGRTPEANVKLALWCETHGLQAERLKHLARAVLSDPTNAMARGLMGLVAYQGQWKRPETVALKVQADQALVARLAEYNTRRAKAHETADSQWSLAIWCEQNGLTAEALAHFTAVTQLDPSREAAWKRLDCKKVNGRWLTEAQIVAEKDEAEAQKKADKLWKPLLTKYRAMLGDKRKKDAAEKALLEVTDPRAVPSVWSVFVAGNSSHDRAVRLLGQIDAAASSKALAVLAVFDDSAEVRRAATETLRRRDPREFAGMLVALLRDPIKYKVQSVGGPGSPGAIFVEGKQFNVQRLYAPPGLPNVPFLPWGQVRYDSNGLPVISATQSQVAGVSQRFERSAQLMTLPEIATYHPTDPGLAQAVDAYRANAMQLWHNLVVSEGRPRTWEIFLNPHDPRYQTGTDRHTHAQIGVRVGAYDTQTDSIDRTTVIPIGQMIAETQKAAIMAEVQLENDVALLDRHNGLARELSGRVAGILREVAGKDLGEGSEPWQAWWVNQQGYAYTPPPQGDRPTVVENVPLAYTPQAAPVTFTGTRSKTTVSDKALPFSTYSCFGAGTLVRTLDGSKPIESIQVGDRVLTQDVKSGALGYHPVTVVHHNPPSPTFLVKVVKDTIVSSPFHRFWIAGTGWKMARDLKGGEILRLLDGPARVDSVEEGPVQLVYNLDVAESHDFFAGASAALVHDNTLPDTRLVAFDAAPVVAVSQSKAR